MESRRAETAARLRTKAERRPRTDPVPRACTTSATWWRTPIIPLTPPSPSPTARPRPAHSTLRSLPPSHSVSDPDASPYLPEISISLDQVTVHQIQTRQLRRAPAPPDRAANTAMPGQAATSPTPTY